MQVTVLVHSLCCCEVEAFMKSQVATQYLEGWYSYEVLPG